MKMDPIQDIWAPPSGQWAFCATTRCRNNCVLT